MLIEQIEVAEPNELHLAQAIKNRRNQKHSSGKRNN